MRPSSQRGFAIIAAIFILVLLAGLGGFIATISSAQHAGSALDVQSAFAYQAARAGTEWGVDKVINGTPAAPPDTVTCSTTLPVPAIVISGITVTVCLKRLASGDSAEIGLGSIWEVTSTACSATSTGSCPGSSVDVASPYYVERRISLLVE